MSFSTRQPFGGASGLNKPIRKLNLSLKKSRNLSKSDKENDSFAANNSIVDHDFHDVETFEVDPFMIGSQNFSLRLSDSANMENYSERISRNNHENSSSKASTNNEDSIVIVNDSYSEESPMDTCRSGLYTSSLVRRDVGKGVKSPARIILLDSSDSEDTNSPDHQLHRSVVNLSSEDESPFDRLKKIRNKLQLTDDISFTSDESSKNKIVVGNKSSSSDSTHVSPTPQPSTVNEKNSTVYKKSSIVNDFGKASISGLVNRSGNSSGSSTHFSPSPESRRLNKTGLHTCPRMINESSSFNSKSTDIIEDSSTDNPRYSSSLHKKDDFHNMITSPSHNSLRKVAMWKSVQDSGIARESDYGNVTCRTIAKSHEQKTFPPDDCNINRKYIIDETMSQQSSDSSITQGTKNKIMPSCNLVDSTDKVGSYNYQNSVTTPVHHSSHKASARNPVHDSGISANVSLKTPGNTSVREKTTNSAKLTSSVKKLTREEALKILNAVKSKSNHSYKPRDGGRKHSGSKLDQSISPSSFSEDISPSQSLSRSKVKKVQIIHETESDTDDDIISRPVNSKPNKTHVSRFLEMPAQPQGQSLLSERRNREISRWLMYSSPASQSDSSSGHVSDSNKNSPSSGNSSLERFEMEHETPNNRGKLFNSTTAEKINSDAATDRVHRVLSKAVVKQNTLDKYIYKPKPRISDIHTPTPTGGILNRQNEQTPIINVPVARHNLRTESTTKNINKISSASVAKTSDTLNIMECADILDKLYGDAWKAKADIVLSASEPRKQNAVKKVQENHTERRVNPKAKKVTRVTLSATDSDGDQFDEFIRDMKPNFNSTKKLPTKSHNSRDSFIEDTSLSENSSESMYHTALTNPREFKDNRRPKNVPVSANTKRAIAICDSDSEDEGYNHNIRDKNLNRKRLSFSNDSDSSTSEFDPGEVVVPKSNTKKALAKTPKSVAGPSVPKVGQSDCKRGKSFLASLSPTVPMSICHPEAKIYRTSYKNNREDLCKNLFKLYNKDIFDNKLPHDMVIEWNVRMRGTAGFCYNKKSTKALGGITRSSRIVLATKILDTPDRLRDTLVHEMCHAAAWLINNVSDGHGPFWKGWASKAMQRFPELPPIKRCHDYKIATKFTYRCMSCGYSIGRHSKSLDIERKRCGHCYGKFELLVNKTTKSGTVQVATPSHSRAPTGFALFVKENYHSVKKTRRSIKHGEVMRILGQQFSAVKIGKRTDDNNK